jgi:hypothetical protein
VEEIRRENEEAEETIMSGPARYGENQSEDEILQTIIFERQLKPGQIKRKSYRQIADQLNAQSRFPRKAQKWDWQLIRHVHLNSIQKAGDR